jgi:penicillin-binding protein 2
MTSLGETSEEEKTSSALRDLVFYAVIVMSFLVVAARLYTVQIRQGADFLKKSRENFIQTRRIEHDRGEIIDREGRVLVANRPSVNVYVTPAFFPNSLRLVEHLGAEIGLSLDESRAAAAAFRRSAAERGPPILFARELSDASARVLRHAQGELELPLEAVPIIEVDSDSGGTEYAAYLDPEHFPSEERVLRRVAEVLEMPDAEAQKLVRRAQRATGLDRYIDILVRPDIPLPMIERLRNEIDLDDLPGVTVRAAKTRDYRHGILAAHLLGYINELSPKELEQKRDLGYRLGDLIGRRGVEESFEDDLRGVDGSENVVVDSKGRVVSSYVVKALESELGVKTPPRAGNRVVLSLDLDIQEVAEKSFPGRAGAVVALEVNSGRLLAITSTPAFNPNLVSGYFQPVEHARLAAIDELRPWRFRAIQDHHPPGSTFKAVTAAAGLIRGVIDEHSRTSCNGSFHLGNVRFRCWKDSGHGSLDTLGAIEASCDVFFYTLGNRIGLDAIAATASELGLGRPTGIDIAGESPGIIPTVAWYNAKVPEGYTPGAAVNASIGQGAVNVTPLQLAVTYAAIANGGTVYEPQVAFRVEAADGRAVRTFKPRVVRQLNYPENVLRTVREGLRRVVNDPGGTAYNRRLKGIEVSGKTGTAQVAHLGSTRVPEAKLPYELRDHAWFAAFAPSGAPEIAVVVLNEHAGHGGSASAPTAMAVISAWWEKKLAKEKLGALEGTAPLMVAVASSDDDDPEER